MRIRIARVITVFVIFLNLLALYFIWKLVIVLNNDNDIDSEGMVGLVRPTISGGSNQLLSDQNKDAQFIEQSLTVVIRAFEFFERDIAGTISSILSLYPNLRILVISDILPYPPLYLEGTSVLNNTRNVRIINMQLDLTNTLEERNPLFFINTKYVLFIPDSTRIFSKNLLPSLVFKYSRLTPTLVAIPFSTPKSATCLKVFLELREWYIRYEASDGDMCDAVQGKHAILVETKTLKQLPEALMLPFPNALYIQTTAQNLKVKLMSDVTFNDGTILFQSRHAKWKLDQLYKARDEHMFKHFRLKKVVRETGTTELYGCTRFTQRCFGTVLNDMPAYLWEGRWTPPCCLEGLRQTARHVFKALDESGVRYWLEGGSLLGAMRASDILPWDYDVDIGIFQDDIPLCSWLLRAQKHQVVDGDGFVWEKATEGEFFRVQFSASNHLHVDLFPFYSRNGTMTKNTWFASHKQDCEFPEHYLSPMASIEFVGRQVPAPNNIRDFLEFKFGKGVVENPQYPDPSKLKFSAKDIPEITNIPIDSI